MFEITGLNPSLKIASLKPCSMLTLSLYAQIASCLTGNLNAGFNPVHPYCTLNQECSQ